MTGDSQVNSGLGDEASDGLRTLIGTGSLYAIGRAVQLSAVVLVLPLLTRVLTPTEYGEIAAALVVMQVLTIVAAGGLPVSITLQFFVGDAGPSRAKTLVCWAVLVGVLTTLLAQILAPMWVNTFSSIEHIASIRVAVLATTPLVVMASVQSLLQVRRQPARYAIVTLAGTAGAQILGLLFVLLWGAHASIYLSGMVVGGTAAAVIGLVLTGVDLQAWRKWRLLFTGLKTGLPTIPHDVSIYILLAGDRVILERTEGLATVGRYQIAYIAGTLGIALLSALNSALLPIIFGAATESRWKLLADIIVSLYWLAAFVAGGLALAAPIMLSALASSAFEPNELAPITSIVALSALPYVTVAAHFLVLLHLGKSVYLAWATPLSAVFNIGLNIVLVPIYGMKASAVLTVASYCFQAATLKLLTRSLVTIPWKRRAVVAPWLVGTSFVAVGIIAPATSGWLAIRGVVSAVLLTGLTIAIARRFRRPGEAVRPSHAESSP